MSALHSPAGCSEAEEEHRAMLWEMDEIVSWWESEYGEDDPFTVGARRLIAVMRVRDGVPARPDAGGEGEQHA